ncbi:hypothetical protein HHI36_018082 [Cryptolaemus montrouzieri]|uniref:Activin types I and II receptor domain-containing protein n=1 Tax=Cryptolaemus montrouzieri TaxID=559131 RepID=A0ABD2NZB8_9CUCU
MCFKRSSNMKGTIFWLFCGILCLTQLFIGVDSLKCKCDICADKNYVCETDGYCFTTTYETKQGGIDHQYRYEFSLSLFNSKRIHSQKIR